MMPPVESPFDLSPADVGKQLGVHEDTIKRWAAEGHLRALKTPGRYWRFSQADVDAFVLAGVQRGSEAAS